MARAQRLRDISVLVVDDTAYIRELLTAQLEAEGAEVKAAANAGAALALLTTWKPALVITDIRMPGGDGLWLLSQVRRLRPDTAVAAISGVFDDDEALDAGFDAFIQKPYTLDELCVNARAALVARVVARA